MDIPGYKIDRQLWDSASGRVLLATKVDSGQRVLIRLFPQELAENPFFQANFLTEGLLARVVKHPNIIPVLDAGQFQQLYYLIVEYVDGETLAQRQGSMGLLDKLFVIKEVAGALAYLHKNNYVHRRVWPSRIYFDRRCRILISDIGLARSVSPEVETQLYVENVSDTICLSPEQRAGNSADHRSDLYSLGALFYSCLLQESPAKSPTPVEISLRTESPMLPSRVSLFQHIIDRAMAHRPEDRFQSAEEFANALGRVSDEQILEIETVAGGNAYSARLDKQAPASHSLSRVFGDNSRREYLPQIKEPAGENFKRIIGRIRYAWHKLRQLEFSNRKWFNPRWPVPMAIVVIIAIPLFLTQSIVVVETSTAIARPHAPLDMVSRTPNSGGSSKIDTRTSEGAPVNTLAIAIEGDAYAPLDMVSGTPKSGNSSKINTRSSDGAPVNIPANGIEEDAHADQSPEVVELTETATVSSAKDQMDTTASEAEQAAYAKLDIQLIGELRKQANEQIDRFALSSPPGNNALETYQTILSLDEENLQAQQGIRLIVEKYVRMAESALAARDLQSARVYIARGLSIDSSNQKLKGLELRLAEMRELIARLTPLLVEAQALGESGYIIFPRERNAWLFYQQVLREDPGNLLAKQGSQKLVESQIRQIQSLAASGARLEATAWLKLAEDQMAGNPAFDEMAASLTPSEDTRGLVPKITDLSPKRSWFGRLAVRDKWSVDKDRDLVVRFRYENFDDLQSQLRGVLINLENDQEVGQATATPLGSEGKETLRFAKPASGFEAGDYLIDLRLGPQTLSTMRVSILDE